MVMSKGSSGYDFTKSLAAHGSDKTDYGQDFSRMPPGIEDGRALLKEAEIRVYKKGKNQGKEFLWLMAIALEPNDVTVRRKRWDAKKKPPGMVMDEPVTYKVAGKRTNVMVPLCDTKKKVKGKEEIVPFDANLADALNEMRKLGGEDYTSDIVSKEIMIEKLKMLVQEKIVTRFVTREGDPSNEYPNPMTFEEWMGADLEYVLGEIPAAIEGAVDEEGGETPVNEEPPADQEPAPPPKKVAPVPAKPVAKQQVAPPAKPVVPAKPAAVPTPPPAPDASVVGEEPSLEELVADAMNDESPTQPNAQAMLKDTAMSLGMTEEQFNECPGWEELGAFIMEAQSAAPAEAGEGPKVGDTGKAILINSMTKKPNPKPTQVEVIEVHADGLTVKNLVTGKTAIGADGKTPMKIAFADFLPL